MWNLVLVAAIVLGASLFVGKHYFGKLSGSSVRSSNNSHYSSGCCSTCSRTTRNCHSKGDLTEEKCSNHTAAVDADLQSKDAVWEKHNG
jgi:hypothetical protein